MNPIYICMVLACAVLAIAEPEPQFSGGIRAAPGYPGSKAGYGGHQRGYGGGYGSRGGYGGYGGGRFARSPAGFENSDFGASSYAGQEFQQQRSLPYGAGTFADPRFDGFQG